MPRIPLVEDLTKAPIPPGWNILVEFEPASAWYYASLTMAAGWLRSGGKIWYNVTAQPPNDVRSQLNKLGVDVDSLEKKDHLRIYDGYTLSLGQRSDEKYGWRSLKVADLSIGWARMAKEKPLDNPVILDISDDLSLLSRFNDERTWIEFELTRGIPVSKYLKLTCVNGITKGIQSDWAYRKLEAAYDGIVDFKLEEIGEELKNLMRIRSMRNVHFDSRWHELKIDDTFEVALTSATRSSTQ